MNDVPDNELHPALPPELHSALSRMSGAVRPAHGATTAIHSGVRRSRRRRTVATALGTTGLVLALVGGGYAVTGALTDSDAKQPDTLLGPTTVPADQFTCSTESRVFGQAPRIADLDEQEEIAEGLRRLNSVQVRYATSSALGVVALVGDDSGDDDYEADPAVVTQLREAGAAHVYEWDGSEDSDWDSPEDQVVSVLDWLLDPAIEDVRKATRGIEGDAGMAIWGEAGAVLLQWKAPVPQEVQDLAGVRPDGVEVIVEAVDYSQADVLDAQERLGSVLTQLGVGDDWTSASSCADGSGLVVGMEPPLTNRGALQADLAEALGIPVMVEPGERIMPLAGG